jgi:DNA-binding transcriptional regulator YiaG
MSSDLEAAMLPQEFKTIQCELRITDGKTADLLGVSIKTVNSWRCGRTRITGPTALAMRMLHKNKDVQYWLEKMGCLTNWTR